MGSSVYLAVNGRELFAEAWPGSPALDFIRRELGLTGTKEGCREGDCGACAVLVGERRAEGPRYRAMPSCLLALGDLEGRHLVTIEGLAEGAGAEGLTPVMEALLEANGSQCGFCSPGFVVSLTAFLAEGGPLDPAAALVAIEGNLCRCTGYGAILRAAKRLREDFAGLPAAPIARVAALVEAKVLPPSCLAFARGELGGAADSAAAAPRGAGGSEGAALGSEGAALVLGGGTDFFVRDPDPAERETLLLISQRPDLARITRIDGPDAARGISVGAAATLRDFFADPLVRTALPGIERFEADVASILVRNRATIGGNVANASPVADMTAMLVALGARVRLESPAGLRELPLEELFLGYKKLDLRPGEIIASFAICELGKSGLFNFEKASKRRHLDIASVNSSIALQMDGDTIARARLTAGGVAPVPLLLREASAFLAGRRADAATALEAARLAAAEASPISDVRGSADYRRALLERLVVAHFARLFPGARIAEELLP